MAAAWSKDGCGDRVLEGGCRKELQSDPQILCRARGHAQLYMVWRFPSLLYRFGNAGLV